jgi:hypothetical protein
MQTINQITETVRPVFTKAVERTTPVLTSAIEGAITLVERIDPTSSQREPVFGSSSASAPAAVAASGDSAQEENKAVDSSVAKKPVVVDPLQKLKVVTGDLLDLWLYEGSKGVTFIQASKAYKLTDPYVHYVDKYEAVKSRSVEVLGEL